MITNCRYREVLKVREVWVCGAGYKQSSSTTYTNNIGKKELDGSCDFKKKQQREMLEHKIFLGPAVFCVVYDALEYAF